MADRTCLGCRKVLQRDDLVRYVVGPQGEIVLDYRGRLPGRGAYTCIDAGCIRQAVARRQFERAFRGRAQAPEADRLIDDLTDALAVKLESLIGMGRKSGVVVSGTSEVLGESARNGSAGWSAKGCAVRW